VHDFEGHQTYSEKRGHNFTLTASFDEVSPEDYDGLVIPAVGPQNTSDSMSAYLEMVRHFDTANKPIAAICHGAQVLAAAGVIEGRPAAPIRPERRSKLAGGRWGEINETFTNAHVDGNLVDRQRLGRAHPEWMRKFSCFWEPD